MVQNYGPRNTPDECGAYLTKVGDTLGKRSISLFDALSKLEETLDSAGFVAATNQKCTKARDSYTCEFNHQSQSHTNAHKASTQPP